ncbi:hypothetical protein DFH27DRAFT_639426 [Peziza echinospora]|nr:hypothetical protein DFH27DRAFT_639426 [Peziza echinospora]
MDAATIDRRAHRAFERQERQDRKVKKKEAALLNTRLYTILGNLAPHFCYRASGRMFGTRYLTKHQFFAHISCDPGLLCAFAHFAGGITEAEATLLLEPLKAGSTVLEYADDIPYCRPEPECDLNLQDISAVAKHLTLHGFAGTGTPFEQLLDPGVCPRLARLTALWMDGRPTFPELGFDQYLKRLRRSLPPAGYKQHEYVRNIKRWRNDKHWGFMRAILRKVMLEKEIAACKREEAEEEEKGGDPTARDIVATLRKELEDELVVVEVRVREA